MEWPGASTHRWFPSPKAGGFSNRGRIPRPEVNQINYVTRVSQPVLMVNGRYDSFLTVETLFDLL